MLTILITGSILALSIGAYGVYTLYNMVNVEDYDDERLQGSGSI